MDGKLFAAQAPSYGAASSGGRSSQPDASKEAVPGRFSAILTPHRSLSRRGFAILMTFVAIVCFGAGTVFLMMGAWPVFGFFGLDVLLVYFAFRANYKSGREYETVDLSPMELKLTRVSPRGQQEDYVFNPYWVRVLLSEWPDGRTVMRLASHGDELVFGRFLSDEERKEFAGVLREALVEARTVRGGL